jgi:hypothetical protein
VNLMKASFLLLLCVATSGLSTAGQNPLPTPPKPPTKHEIVTGAQANGVYRNRGSEIRILALGHQRLKVQFDLTYEYKSPKGPMANLGGAMGEAKIEGNVATFKPPDTERCEITLVFLPGKLKVTQDGSDADCGFGHNVYATGTYRKIRSGKPKFESPP